MAEIPAKTTSPFPVNSTAHTVNQVIDGVFSGAVKLVEAAIIVEVPLLANPVLQTIDNAIIEYIANKLYQEFAKFVTFEIIDFQVSGQLSDQLKALVALKSAQKSGDKNAIATALAAFQKTTVALTHLDGSANPGSM